MTQKLTKLLKQNIPSQNNFSKKNKAYEHPTRVNRTFALGQLSNLPSYGKISQSTCIDSARSGIKESQTQIPSHTKLNTRITSIGSRTQTQKQIKQNQLIPGIKFGRFFGTIQDATNRVIARRISQRIESKNPQQKPQIGEMTILKETVNILNKNKQPSQTQKLLLKQIQQMTSQLNKLQQQHPKLQQQNRELKQENRNLKTTQSINQTKQAWWQKYCMQKDMEVIRKINSNFVSEMKFANMINCPSRASSRSMYVKGNQHKY